MVDLRVSAPVSAFLVALLTATACTPPTPAPALSPPAAAELEAAAAVPNHGLALVVYKGRRELDVVHDGHVLHTFPVVLGRRNEGAKRYEGDARTPEGAYRVTEVRPHARWRYFIAIDYPNDDDVAAYAAAIAAGKVPVIDGEFVGLGGGLGIHGTDHPQEQAVGVDWTKGCIALDNDDVGVLAELVSPGTPVVIVP